MTIMLSVNVNMILFMCSLLRFRMLLHFFWYKCCVFYTTMVSCSVAVLKRYINTK